MLIDFNSLFCGIFTLSSIQSYYVPTHPPPLCNNSQILPITGTIFFPIFPRFLEWLLHLAPINPYHSRSPNAQVWTPSLDFCLMGNAYIAVCLTPNICHTGLASCSASLITHIMQLHTCIVASYMASLPFHSCVKLHTSCLFTLHLTTIAYHTIYSTYVCTASYIVHKTSIEHQEDLSLVLLEISHSY